MTDLSRVLPDFPTAKYARLLPTIEKQQLTVTDLLTLEVPEIGKRTQLPLLDLKRLCNAILDAIHADLGVVDVDVDVKGKEKKDQSDGSVLRQTGEELFSKPWHTISTLDPSLDAALGGGIPTGYLTEITGESGAGKTQFLLTVLLSAQLPLPHGLARPALYISTEAALSTTRLSQILSHHPFFASLDSSIPRPSLDGIISTVVPDLESQEHILTYQVPVEVSRRNIGLIVLDSVAANYRAEFERGNTNSNMAARSAELVRLGSLLRDLARKHDLAVVVANQVADRFSGSLPSSAKHGSSARPQITTQTPGPKRTFNLQDPLSQESPLASRSRHVTDPVSLDAEPASSLADIVVRSSMPEPIPEESVSEPAALSLDHQQRWFTGWGDDPAAEHSNLKTPSLGLVWSTQIAARIALLRRPVYGRKEVVGDDEDEETGVGPYVKTSRRFMKVVFAPHVQESGQGLEGAVEFEVTMGGLRSVERKGKGRKRKAVE
ncbi:DNA repair protein RAD57 [Xylariaceae sp. FL1272]|nr:DNA repair protein RAD57 [Xylariaceae sp. FL1272]